MFLLLIASSIICLTIALILFLNNKMPKTTAIMLTTSIAIVVFAFSTPQGELYLSQWTADAKRGNWLIIDNNGGKAMRHWILKNGYANYSNQSNGWKFYDKEGNLNYISGENTFVIKIKEPLKNFKTDYKTKYNIPKQQKALE